MPRAESPRDGRSRGENWIAICPRTTAFSSFLLLTGNHVVFSLLPHHESCSEYYTSNCPQSVVFLQQQFSFVVGFAGNEDGQSGGRVCAEISKLNANTRNRDNTKVAVICVDTPKKSKSCDKHYGRD